ncbi:putative lipoprotein [Lunatimonas lonarensis]|uniref:Putative lipoprotein n=1 Tax=Lunatimonas lonarensis TaxID=1232681 RepID=R7ZV97_9BACT|nr:BF3164 family lipoprotein [Lunatimonas lonarensis]EON77929.1 putative lipoprotein [Lunatimonas lonarensis]
MKKINKIYILPFLLLSACTNSNEQEKAAKKISFGDFGPVEKIQGESIVQNDYNINRLVYVMDTLLLLMTESGKYFFNVYHKNTLEYQGSFGVRGEGPEEWRMINFAGQFEIASSGICIWVSEYHRGFISKINITKTLKNSSPYPVIDQTININSKKFPFLDMIYVSDEKLISRCWIYEEDYVRIKSLDPKTQNIKKSELFPKITNVEKLPADIINSLYTATLSKHPSKNLFVQATFIFDRIDIFDEDLKLVRSIVDGNNWRDEYYDALEIDVESDFISDKVSGYNNISLTERYIFAIDAKSKISQVDGTVLEKTIKVFDWEGNPVCLMRTTDNIFGISVDEQEGVLYATDMENEKVLRYAIKDLMERWEK